MSTTPQDWLENSLKQQVSIWCEDPELNTEKIARGIVEKTYLTYRILYKQIGRDLIAVRHRYSEFENLRLELRDRYHPLGILVPSLPPKNTLSIQSKFSDGFVKERTLGLTLFCESVAGSPWLRNDNTWKTFMRPTNTTGVVGSEDSKNYGEQQLISCLNCLDLPYKFTMAQRMEDIKNEVIMIERQVRYVLEKVRGLQAAERNLAITQEALKAALEGWYDAERLHVKSLGGKIFDEHEPVVKPHETVLTTLTNFNNTYGTRVNSEKDNGQLVGLTFSSVLEYELSNVESFKELFKLHDEMISTIDNLSMKIGKLENSRGLQTNIKNYELLQDYKRQLSEKQECLQAFYKGFVYFTIPLMARLRSYYYRRLLSGYLTSQYTSSYCVYQSCHEFYEKSILNAFYVNDETSRMFELLGMKALAKLPTEESSDDDEDDVVNTGVAEETEKLSLGSTSPMAKKKKSVVIGSPLAANKSGQQFMTDETFAMTGLFDRGLTISKGKSSATNTNVTNSAVNPTPGGNSNATYTPTTHLFTSSIIPTAVDNYADYTSADGNPLSPSNPLASRRASAIVKVNTTTNSGTYIPAEPVEEHLSIPHQSRAETVSPVPTADSENNETGEEDLFLTTGTKTPTKGSSYDDLLYVPGGDAPTTSPPRPPSTAAPAVRPASVAVGANSAKTEKSKALLEGLLDGSKQNTKNVWDD